LTRCVRPGDLTDRYPSPPCQRRGRGIPRNSVKPEHLFLGTPKQNTRDMVSKNRHSYGQQNGMSRLRESDVLKIRELYESGKNQQEIADFFNVSRPYISTIVHGRSWSHIGGPIIKEPYEGKRHKLRKIDESQILLIRQKRLQGRTLKSIAAEYSISYQRVSQICQD